MKIVAKLARLRHAFEPIYLCKWAAYILVCPVVEDLEEFSLSDTRFNSAVVTVPFRHGVKKRVGIVACFSPLFYNERWQLIVQVLETYRQLGVNLQVYYIQSMLTEILNFMKVYEALNIIAIESWSHIKLSPRYSSSVDYDPNNELEWRNQGTAHTDCLIKYKQAADFIIISDVDDVLFPKLGRNYMEEFQRLAFTFPLAAGFSYDRYNTDLISSRKYKNFSLLTNLNSARISNQWEDGKYVVIPNRVESAWLHWPGIIKPNYRMHDVLDKFNIIVHMRNWTLTDGNTDNVLRSHHAEFFSYQLGDIISHESIQNIERNFRRFVHRYAQEEFNNLPKESHYYFLIEQCYDKIFYSRGKRPEFCPGPLRCDIPSIQGVKCSIARNTYKHKFMNNKLSLHYATKRNEFEISYDGCKMQ